jgi:hypothetical protein
MSLKADSDLNRRQQSKQGDKNLSENEPAGETHLKGERHCESQSNANFSLAVASVSSCSVQLPFPE